MATAATSLTMSRLLPTSTTATTTRLSNPSHLSFTSSISLLSLRSKLHPKSLPLTHLQSSTTNTTVVSAISVGDKLPESILSYLDADNEVKTVTISDLTKGKKAILFAVPGAFTPTCSQKHLPSFVEKSQELKAKGVDTIACISVNDAFVMKAWKADLKIGDEVLLLSDGNGDFTRAIGAELDLSDKPIGLGVRSRRYALLAEDGVVKVLNLEEGGAFTFSGAEDMLSAL